MQKRLILFLLILLCLVSFSGCSGDDETYEEYVFPTSNDTIKISQLYVGDLTNLNSAAL